MFNCTFSCRWRVTNWYKPCCARTQRPPPAWGEQLYVTFRYVTLRFQYKMPIRKRMRFPIDETLRNLENFVLFFAKFHCFLLAAKTPYFLYVFPFTSVQLWLNWLLKFSKFCTCKSFPWCQALIPCGIRSSDAVYFSIHRSPVEYPIDFISFSDIYRMKIDIKTKQIQETGNIGPRAAPRCKDFGICWQNRHHMITFRASNAVQ